MSHYIKCPDCGNEGYQYLEEKRRRFRCYSCGLDTYLKLLNIEAYNEKKYESNKSI